MDMIAEFGGNPDDPVAIDAALAKYGGDPDNRNYIHAVERKRVAAMTDVQVFEALFTRTAGDVTGDAAG
jgi:hypothetical protein